MYLGRSALSAALIRFSSAAPVYAPMMRPLRASFTRLTAIAGLSQDSAAPLDAMVERALRPLLAQWLDAHLPALVERLVREEIARIAGPRG